MAGTEDQGTRFLLVTANVGSLFEAPEKLRKIWLEGFFKTIKAHKPHFLALHCQELGGKTLDTAVTEVDRFVQDVMGCEELKEYNRVRVYIDETYKVPERFTALGSFYFIHESVKNVFEFDFKAAEYQRVQGKSIYRENESLPGSVMVQKEKFPEEQNKGSRKGFIRTRWSLSSCDFDLVNVHLFHDANNVVAWDKSPSVYAGHRKKAMDFVLERISDSKFEELPFFLFGDFNFRLDARPLIKFICPDAKLEIIRDDTNEVYKLVARECGNDRKVLLEVEKKMFNYADPDYFVEHNRAKLLEFDQEPSAFKDRLEEMKITFPPTYPFSEEVDLGRNYNTTRCPAWCDRILMSPSAKKLFAQPKEGEDTDNTIVYNTIGPLDCMGDHKPVFLSFRLTAGTGNPNACSWRYCVVQ